MRALTPVAAILLASISASGKSYEAERYDVACVVGVEMMRNVASRDAVSNLGAAAWVPPGLGAWGLADMFDLHRLDTASRPHNALTDVSGKCRSG